MSKHLAPLILAIDTSCDETSVAVTRGVTILSNVVASQINLHKEYGGVFPTLAKQAHQAKIAPCTKKALKLAGLALSDIQAIAITQGPGLAPALEVGITYAKQLASENHKPLIAVNHIEAHALSVLARGRKREKVFKQKTSGLLNTDRPNPFTSLDLPNLEQLLPALAIIVSGGHSQFVYISKIGEYQILGETLDDAVGESLDKVGRMLELGYPAGPVVEHLAKQGNPQTYAFPLPMTTSGDYNLSFSGLKTSASNLLVKLGGIEQLTAQDIGNFCASYQFAVFRHLTHKLKKLLSEYMASKQQAGNNTANKNSSPLQANKTINSVWLGGGVVANTALRQAVRQTIKPFQLKLLTPYNKKLCGDNAGMIGVTAYFQWLNKDWLEGKQITSLDRKPRLGLGGYTSK